MKTITTALVLLYVASFAGAASFTWASTDKISYNGATTIATAGGITAQLIYLGTAQSASVSNYGVSNGTVVQTAVTKSSGVATGKGKYSATYSEALGASIGSSTFAAGDNFTVLLTYTDPENVTWYNLSSTVWQFPTTADDVTTDLSGPFSHNFAMQEKGTALSAGGGWVAAAAVPEPATGALALAGIALLFKRRKARA